MSQPQKNSRSKTESNLVKITDKKTKTSRPATTPEAREQQLVKLAVDLAEKQLRDGTASPSVINHFLKMSTKKEILEREMLQKQLVYIDAKASSITKEQDAQSLAKEAIEAMKDYNSGS